MSNTKIQIILSFYLDALISEYVQFKAIEDGGTFSTRVAGCMILSRNRLTYALLTAGVMLAGFLSRHLLGDYAFIKLYVGDALWAMMVFFGFAFVFRRWSTLHVATAALAFSVCIEVSWTANLCFGGKNNDLLYNSRNGGLWIEK